jgi:6-pyruvoyl-tetrahydropterin synthase
MNITFSLVKKLSFAHHLPIDIVGANMSELHGHEVAVIFTFDSKKKSLADRHEIEQVLDETLSRYNNSTLNNHVPTATGEMLTHALLKDLQNTPLAAALKKVGIIETRKNRFYGVLTNSCEST